MRAARSDPIEYERGRDFLNWPVLLSVVLFALNNWWLKGAFHSWATGKLSDVLFCFFFPLYCSAILAFVTRWSLRRRVWVGAAATLAVFVAMKTSLAFSSWASELLSAVSRLLFGGDSVNYADPTDLVATPFVLLAVRFALGRRICWSFSGAYRRALVGLGLVAATPLLVGHGACFEVFGHQCPTNVFYTMSGSMQLDASSPISVGYNMNMSVNGQSYTSSVATTGILVPPFVYVLGYNDDITPHNISTTVNDAFPGGSAIGEIWLLAKPQNDSSFGIIKLLHSAPRNSFLNASFYVVDSDFALPQSSTAAGSSSYTLAGGSTGTEELTLLAEVTISVNGQQIYTRSASDTALTQPIVFQANPGDELRILAGGVFPSLSLSPIWLFTPSGNGIKLSHTVSNADPAATKVFFDVVHSL